MKLTENPHSAPGNWYRGNLHTHSTRSDGKLPPQEVVRWYAQHGYDFVAMTDHWQSAHEAAENAPITVLIGQEIDVTPPSPAMSLHIVAIGLNEQPTLPEGRPAQASLNVLLEMGAICFLAHPYWSGLTYVEMLPIEGISGVEIFNGSATDDNGKVLSLVQWDDLLYRGKFWPAIASDDAHTILMDGGRGWVYVKAAENTPAALMDALRRGQFYSSSGPQIETFEISGDTVTVRCSPAAKINLVAAGERGQARLMKDAPLTEAVFFLRKNERYIRVECVDDHGRAAWTNAFELP